MTQTALRWIDAPPRNDEPNLAVLNGARSHSSLPCDPASAYAQLTGLPFALADLTSGMLTYSSFVDLCPILKPEVLDELRTGKCPHVIVDREHDLIYYAVRLPGVSTLEQLAVGFVPRDRTSPSAALKQAACDAGWSRSELQLWLDSIQPVSPEVLPRFLRLAEMQVCAAPDARMSRQMEEIAGQLDGAYEELSLLHDVSRNLRVSLDPVELAQTCVHRLHLAINAEGCGILLVPRDSPVRFVSDGRLPCDEVDLQRLLQGANTHIGRRPLVRNHLEESPRGAEVPHLRNYVAAAILQGETTVGWIIACNSIDRSEFGTVEANLLNSVALILSTHLHNILLFHEQEDLLIAFVRSLVSTLDAKDSYTRGHSERVALVARRLAQQLGLTPREQEDIHLAALLHDIGKIGVEDAILGKPGRLTEAEFRKLQLHPVIGHDILLGLKNLHHILPGVRNHHESFDGTGYPDRLKAEDIPMMARILAVADAFDAMGSDRPYRGGMPLEQIERILLEGSGSQWDARVIRAYFAAREDIRRIWETCRESAEPRSL
jgi:HD-GYP domain-containing protein (c-di-GMP phosphodiesterase class II)